MTERAVPSRSGVRRRRGGKLFFVAALAVNALAWEPSTYAQIDPFYGLPSLTQEDWQAGIAAAQRLLNREPASVGLTDTWVGPKTGDRGTFTILEVFEHSGMPCRTLRNQIFYNQSQTQSVFRLVACRTATGEWKVVD
ncbi:MAG: hypothetical protein JOY71_25290 [Acetobacteraceae bacterium]|nr:hypothetical protein [Acetobacteraceae bacterium]MBV8525398.1 hypothetical protein [Acetobacteraceae bacterium]MBV8590986.1 hypothetical protein [Acetobacteraceae bacterium]